ncbi:MAG: putative toxin-antitoxin system toxin component, PIN family [Anaerolineae bacterium]
MTSPAVVLDTNVIIAALRSRRGASYRLLSLVGQGVFEINVSVPLVLEYEDAAKRLIGETDLTAQDIDDILDYLCSVANRYAVFFLWRPFLRDDKDDMVLELAVASGCDAIVTYNQRDFVGVQQFGIRLLTPKAFLVELGEAS